MKGLILFTFCILGIFIVVECDSLHRNTKASALHKSLDGYMPYVTRPRFGSYGKKRNEGTNHEEYDGIKSSNTYREIKDLTNDDINDGDDIIVLEEVNNDVDETNDDSNDRKIKNNYYYEDPELPRYHRMRYFFEQHRGGKREDANGDKPGSRRGRWGGDAPESRWGRFGDALESRWGRFGDAGTENNDVPESRWGRFGDEAEEKNNVPESRWRRFGDHINKHHHAPESRWGRFGDEEMGNDVVPESRWGRFGDESSDRHNVLESRWGRFGDVIMKDNRKSSQGRIWSRLGREEVRPRKPRWGRFGREMKVDLIKDNINKDDSR